MKKAVLRLFDQFNRYSIRKNREVNLRDYYSNDLLLNRDLGISTESYFKGREVIINLTTYSKRIKEVHFVIQSLMNQTIKANRIILWLNSPFNKENIPNSLKRLIDRGLEINFVEDFKSYDKIIHALINYPNDILITVDDDIMYPYFFIEYLIEAFSANNSINYYRGHRITLNASGEIRKYHKWLIEAANYDADVLNFPTTGGGIIYPPHSLFKDVTNSSIFCDLCPSADDIWLWAMSSFNKSKSYRVPLNTNFFDTMIELSSTQDIGLYNQNVLNNQNDVQISRILERYPIL